ncbi:ATP-binding protein [Nonomuraea sp. LPB2021202275-12-8]|uniref:ATP-binding protein n=1 Tax=Nonomuraea sp. LPB2021202275-12-8 TaxID=3120159 RepID=UPI00300C0693
MIASPSRRHRTSTLPAEVTSFVGRRHEVAEVKQFLCTSRTVTLTGAGGVGKTRLALRAGAEVGRAFRDGVWLAELAALDGPGMLAQSVAEALEIRDRSASSPLRVLTEHLRDKQALLILDNCEHLVEECAVLAETLMRAAPELRILATSRQALGIAGEQALTVPALPLPAFGESRGSLDALLRSDAVRLFAERARAVLPTFAVTEENRDAVAAICRRVDGLPLAIELAAARLRALSAQQLLDRLDDRFRLLTAGSRAVLPRHQTLRALIDWSYALCSDSERLLWERASVFADTFDLAAAEAVLAGDGIAREEVVDLVIGLVDKSILTREDHQQNVRYRMLDTIRQYGRDRLTASGQEAALRRRHRDHYRDLAARARAELFGPAQVTWFTLLNLEHANLRTALESAFGEPDGITDGLGMTTDLLYHWITSYYLGEGRSWFDRGLAADSEPSDVRARALWAGSWLAVIQGDIPAATAMLEESRRIGESLEDESILGYVALFSGMVAMSGGHAQSAIKLYEDALARLCGTQDPVGEALSLIRLSLAHSFLDDSSLAIRLAEECLSVCDAHGEGWHRAYTMMALGVEVWLHGDVERAAELEKQSLTFNRSLGDTLGVGVNLEVLAWIAATQERWERAARLLGSLRTVWRSVGAPLGGYGHLAGYHDDCERRTREALGEHAFAAAVRQGSRLPYDESLAYGLEEEPAAEDGPAEPAPLTPRETEIAQLVAQGMTNKEIAASLVIAQRTAEGHIEHILSKLGFHSRAQIAVWVGERARATDEAQ